MNSKPYLQNALLIAIGLSATALYAADKTPPAPPRDPFLKERGAPSTAPDLTGAITSITTIFEVYNLAPEDAVSLLTSPPDPTARYLRVTELVKAGRAKLEEIAASANKNSQRSLVSSVDAIPLPQNYLPLTDADAPCVPNLYTPCELGDLLETEPILSPDAKVCNLNFMIDVSAFLGATDYRTSPKAPARGCGNLEKRYLITSLALKTGVPVLVGTLSRSPTASGESEISVVFARVNVTNERPAKAAAPLGVIAYSEHLLTLYSVERSAAAPLLAENTAPGACFAAVQALAAKKQAKLEHMALLPAQAGMTAQIQENIITRQPTVVKPPAAAPEGPRATDPAAKAGTPKPSVIYLEELGKNHGLSVELESVIGPADAALKGVPLVADVSAAIMWQANAGIFDTGDPAANFPEVGVSEMRKIQCSIQAYVSVPTFLGTLNPPRATGVNQRKDTGRVWLAFLEITPVAP